MIVEESKMMSAADVARKHGISKSMVVRWRQDEIKIRKALESHGGETKKIYVLYDWNTYSDRDYILCLEIILLIFHL